MNKQEFPEVLKSIQESDGRYQEGAYWFVRHALDHTIKNLKKGSTTPPKQNNHVSGKQLLNGIRDYAIDQYGPMAKTSSTHGVSPNAKILEKLYSISWNTEFLAKQRRTAAKILPEATIFMKPS